jgi:hypothetical protein
VLLLLPVTAMDEERSAPAWLSSRQETEASTNCSSPVASRRGEGRIGRSRQEKERLRERERTKG